MTLYILLLADVNMDCVTADGCYIVEYTLKSLRPTVVFANKILILVWLWIIRSSEKNFSSVGIPCIVRVMKGTEN